MADTWDLLVVGGGPAGSAAALAAKLRRPDARVLLLDRSDFPRDKACGDGIAAHGRDELAKLGLPDLVADYKPTTKLSVVSPGGATVSATAARPNHVVPRKVFDARLVDAAVARGALLRRHRVRALRVEPDRVVIDERFAARVVIGADGANSVVRRLTGAPPTPPRAVAVAIRGYAPVAARPDELVIEFARGRYPAYAWAFPVAGGGANVGYGVFDRRGGGSRRELLAALAALLPGEEPDPTSVRGHHLPLSTGPRHHPDGRVLLVGDAAALVNPLTGEGIYDAVASGALAGRAALNGLDGGDAGRTHRAAMRRAFGRHRSHLAVLARLVPHARFLDAAVAAAARDPAVFDAAVDLGLAGGTADWHAVRAITRALLGRAEGAGVG